MLFVYDIFLMVFHQVVPSYWTYTYFTPFYFAKENRENGEDYLGEGELLIQYMKNRGWDFYDQMGCEYFFKKGGTIKHIYCTQVKTLNNISDL